MRAIAVLDAGTGGAKCTVFGADGTLLDLHSENWRYQVHANRDVPMVKEYSFDPQQFWNVLTRCMQSALAVAGVASSDIVGVATTSQREGCVFLAEDGREVYAGPNLDSRAFAEGLEILGTLGPQRLYEITGHSAPFIFPLARYLWHRKQGGAAAACILMINDWMSYRLSGRVCTEPSNAAESMLLDFRTREWSAEILDIFDIPGTVLPPIVTSGTCVGAVTRAAAAETGLREGTPVFAGGADTQCALLGAGAVEVGDTAAIFGTTAPIQTVVDHPMLDPAANLWAGCHVVPNRWVVESNLGSTGDAYTWLVELLLGDGEQRFARAETLAETERDTGAFTFLGPRVFNLTTLRPDMPGGLFFRFPTLQLRPSAGDLLRAFLESVAYAVRANLEQLTAVTGRLPSPLLVGGGMSRNAALLQMVADQTGLPVARATEAQSTGLGCAMLVSAGLGLYPSPAAAVASMCRHEIVAPRPDRKLNCDTAYAKWRELYQSLENLSV